MVGLITWGRFYLYVDGKQQFNSDGSPVRVTVPNDPHLWVMLRKMGASLFPNFDVIQLPPDHKAQGGNGAGVDGYEGYDWRDLGTKNQQGSIATRYGTLEEEMALIACAHSYGTKVLGDFTVHQMGGDNNGVIKYLGADGKTLNGRGAKHPGHFRGQTSWNGSARTWWDPIPPYVEADPVPVMADDFPFGRETAPKNATPSGSLLADMIDTIGWKAKRLGTDGDRFDDTKGTNSECVKAIMDSVPGRLFYSEYFDGNPNNLNWWATSYPMYGRSLVEDFPFHFSIQAACNGFDATQFFNGSAYWKIRPDLSVVFVDNPDTDTSDGQQVIFNKGLAYAFMLNVPCNIALVYGKDYMPSSVWPGAYGLKPIIDNLLWTSRTFAFGNFQERWSDKDVFAFTRDGNGGAIGWSGGLLVAGNFNVLSSRTITVQTMWPQGQWIHDYSGHAPDLTVGANGVVTLTIPSNGYSNGVSFVTYAPRGVTRPFVPAPIKTTQTFFGVSDLDVMPLLNDVQTLPQAIYPKNGTILSLVFKANYIGGLVTIQVTDSKDNSITSSGTTTGSVNLSMTVKSSTAHTIKLIGKGLPTQGINFEVEVTYTGVTG